MKKLPWLRIGKATVLIFSCVAYAYIALRLIRFEHWPTLLASVSFSVKTVTLLGILTALWFINLGCETKRWQILMKPFTKLSLSEAWKQVMAGTTTAVGSPSRIAEMGGRMALLPKRNRMNAAVMTTVGGIFQNMVILVAGVISLLLVPKPSLTFNNQFKYLFLILLPVFIGAGFVIIWAFYKEKVKYYFRTLKALSNRIFFKLLLWTVTRYLVYIIQLFVWLNFWGIHVSFVNYLALSTLYFFFITILPSHILIDMGIRGSVAIFLFTSISANTPLILLATFSLWITNVVLPTIIGSYTLLKHSLIKQRLKQKEL